jgi:hypothetical protein
LAYWFYRKSQRRNRQKKPGHIKNQKRRANQNVNNKSDKDSPEAEYGPENPAHYRVVLIQRLEDMAERHPERQGAVEIFQKRNKSVEKIPGCVRVPMVEKILNPEEKTAENVYQRKIHTFKL